MVSDTQDTIAIKLNQVRALLNMMQVSGHDVPRSDLVEVIGVAAELAEDACTMTSEEEQEGNKKPGNRPASVVIEPCNKGVVCHLRTLVDASNA